MYYALVFDFEKRRTNQNVVQHKQTATATNDSTFFRYL